MYTCRIHTCDIRNASDKVSLLFDKRVNQSSFLYKKLILLQSFGQIAPQVLMDDIGERVKRYDPWSTIQSNAHYQQTYYSDRWQATPKL